jgi:hypothetical protein
VVVGDGWGREKNWSGPELLGCRRDINVDGCGRSVYKGENFDDHNDIFHFEGGNERQVWMV